MVVASSAARALAGHPIHAMVLAGAVPLFLGAALADWAYAATYEIQWINFAAWLIAGGLVFTGLAFAWAIIAALTGRAGGTMRWLYAGLLAATFILGFVNALVHAKDGWGAMPAGLILSLAVMVVALAASFIGLARRTQERVT